MSDQQISYDNIVDLLLLEAPELHPLFEEHLRDQFGELLQHVFFGDLARYLVDQVRLEGADVEKCRSGGVARILGVLERAMASHDERVRELVSVSFVENLDPSDEAYKAVKSMLGPNLQEELRTYKK